MVGLWAGALNRIFRRCCGEPIQSKGTAGPDPAVEVPIGLNGCGWPAPPYDLILISFDGPLRGLVCVPHRGNVVA